VFKVDLKNRTPIYEQITTNFKRLIRSGQMKAEAKVPSVRDMAQELNVNPNTVQKAYRELESHGYFYTVPGQGNFVAELSEQAAAQGAVTAYKALDEKVQELVFLGEAPGKIVTHVDSFLKRSYNPTGDPQSPVENLTTVERNDKNE